MENNRTVVGLGVFDGVHLGHRTVIDTVLKRAEESGCIPAIFTFNTLSVTTKGDLEPIMSDSEKKRRLEKLGIEYVYAADMHELKELTAEQFVDEVISGRMNAAEAVCGEDFRFGRGGKADGEELRRLCAPLGISVTVVPQFKIGGASVSSTRIRSLISGGEIAQANALLGWRFGFEAEVMHGRELGRTWDFPTINQQLPQDMVCPRYGVYCAKVCIGGEWHEGVCNIGVKPTVEGERMPLAETYIIGYSGDLYGQRLRVKLYEFVRPEKRFGDFDGLRAEIARNTEFAKKYFKIGEP